MEKEISRLQKHCAHFAPDIASQSPARNRAIRCNIFVRLRRTKMISASIPCAPRADGAAEHKQRNCLAAISPRSPCATTPAIPARPFPAAGSTREKKSRQAGNNFLTQPALFFLVIFFLAGCEIQNVYFNLIQGQYYYGRGQYQEAIVSYMRALESDQHTRWVEYNLGNAYYSLGEVEAAASIWDKAAQTTEPALQFHIAYNKGSLYYEMGKYQEACGEFKHALRLEPSALDAKINLELSLRKMSSGGGTQSPGNSGPPPAGDDASRILDYVKRREGTKWKASDEINHRDADDW
jgi:tetratricopeptide (TPR) repeat protein